LLSGSYTGITGVGTLTAGSIPFTLLSGSATAAQIPSTLNATTFSGLVTLASAGAALSNGTKLLDTANGTLAVQTSTGTFGTLLLGAAGTTTGIRLRAVNGTLNIEDGIGGSTVSLLMGFGNFNNSVAIGTGLNGTYINSNFVSGGNGSQTTGKITFPTTTTATVTIAGATAPAIGVPAVTVAGGLGYQATTVNLSGSFTLTAAQSGMFVYTTGTAPITVTLPAAANGLVFEIISNTTAAVTVSTGATNMRTSGLTDAAARTMGAYVSGGNQTSIKLTCNGSVWFVTNVVGSLT
jgi:hypothetical protein